MDGSNPAARTWMIAVVVCLAGAALAGCTQQGGDGGPRYASFSEAKDAPGKVYEPNGTRSSIRVKVLEPADPAHAHSGEVEIALLVYDASTDEPVTDADFSADDEECNAQDAFCAWMPAMGHGTSPEESPEHDAHGVYVGMTNFKMAGDWQLQLNPAIDGEVVPFDIPFTVEGAHDDSDGH